MNKLTLIYEMENGRQLHVVNNDVPPELFENSGEKVKDRIITPMVCCLALEVCGYPTVEGLMAEAKRLNLLKDRE